VHDRTLWRPLWQNSVLSAVCMVNAPYEEGASTDAARANRCWKTRSKRARVECPRNPPARLRPHNSWLPADLERKFRLTGGTGTTASIALDQFLMLDGARAAQVNGDAVTGPVPVRRVERIRVAVRQWLRGQMRQAVIRRGA